MAGALAEFVWIVAGIVGGILTLGAIGAGIARLHDYIEKENDHGDT